MVFIVPKALATNNVHKHKKDEEGEDKWKERGAKRGQRPNHSCWLR